MVQKEKMNLKREKIMSINFLGHEFSDKAYANARMNK